MVKNKPSSTLTILVIIFLLFLCGSLVTVVFGTEMILSEVERVYGTSETSLSSIQRINYGIQLYLNGSDLLIDNVQMSEPIYFEVSSGESVGQIAFRLQSDRYISNAELFKSYLIYRGYDRHIQVGVFRIDPEMNGLDIAEKLLDTTPDKVRFIILAGWRAEEVAAALENLGFSFGSDDFLAIIKNPPSNWMPEEFLNATTLEGYLLPGEYFVDREIVLREFIRMILDRFKESVSNEIRTAINNQGLTFEDAIILASIVEREAVVDEEMPMIASVFLNRYTIGMKLDSDPTVQYAVGYNFSQVTWWTNPLSFADLQFDSDFNTYIYAGLPPTAICSPGLNAIQAVAFPADTPYYYFRAKCNGSGLHEFAINYEEHLQNGCP
jgi:UPF0755 protein